MCVCCVFIAFPSFRRPFWAIFYLTVDATACHVLKLSLVRDMPSHRPLSRKSPKTASGSLEKRYKHSKHTTGIFLKPYFDFNVFSAENRPLFSIEIQLHTISHITLWLPVVSASYRFHCNSTMWNHQVVF